MAVSVDKINKNLSKIRGVISESCKSSNRNIEEISIVAVTKTEDVETIKALIDAGITDFGEGKVSELVNKSQELAQYLTRRRNPFPKPIRWHMVGHVQRNKVKKLVRSAQVIHSVDSLRLAEELSQQAEKTDQIIDVMLQINCSGESQKFGCVVGAATPLAELLSSMPGLRLVGLMTMGPLNEDREGTRNCFARLRELYDDMVSADIGGKDFHHLSMGMSNDYDIAVEEGATILRIGRSLFE